MDKAIKEKHVVFGTGPVGIAVAQSLISRGKKVTVVNRSGKIPTAFAEAQVQVVSCDLLNPAVVLKAAEGASHIYHCANPLYHQWATILPSMQASMIEAALKNDAVLVVAENLYMYARGVDKITDSTQISPPTRKGQIRQELALKLEKAGVELGLKWVSVRASDYYGPWAGYQSVFGTDRFLDVIQKGKNPGTLGKLDVLHSYTFLGDFGEALVLAGLDSKSHQRSWICPNSPATSTRTVAQIFTKNWPVALSKNVKFSSIPKFALSLIGLFDPVVRELKEMLYQKEEPYVVEGSDFEKAFGLKATPLEMGVMKTLEWYQSQV